MLKVLDTLVSILLLRKGPQDLPAGWGWLLLFIAVNYFLNLYQYSIITSLQTTTDLNTTGSWSSIQDILMQIVLVSSVLLLARQGARIIQTLTAFLGVGILFSLMLAPLLQLSLSSEGASGGGLLLALMAWSIAVEGNIFKHALSISMQRGVAIAIALFIAAYLIAYILAGAT